MTLTFGSYLDRAVFVSIFNNRAGTILVYLCVYILVCTLFIIHATYVFTHATYIEYLDDIHI